MNLLVGSNMQAHGILGPSGQLDLLGLGSLRSLVDPMELLEHLEVSEAGARTRTHADADADAVKNPQGW